MQIIPLFTKAHLAVVGNIQLRIVRYPTIHRGVTQFTKNRRFEIMYYRLGYKRKLCYVSTVYMYSIE